MLLRNVLFVACIAGLMPAGFGPARGQEPGRPDLPPLILPAASADNLLPLLKRPDVQNQIVLSLKQKNDLDDLLNNPEAGSLRVRLEASPDQDEESRRKQIQDQIDAQQGSVMGKIRSVLKPDQLDRLNQLQLQWIGPLILGDSKVAERLKIGSAHRAEIGRIAGEYQAVKGQVMMDLAQKDEQTSPDGNQLVRVRVHTEELEKPLSPAYKRLSAAKSAAETQILALLSDAEKAAWKAAQGAPFRFRTDLPGNRF